MAGRKGVQSCGLADFQVGRWQVQPTLNQVRDGRTIRHLEPQVVDLLVFLASNDGRVVSKDDIIAAVWDGRFIAETTLTRSIADLRRALGDDTHKPQYIETIPKRGYRFVAAVTGLERGGSPAEGAGAGASESRPEPAPQPSLVVLPFANIGAETDRYFCEGLTEEVINVLTRVSGLRVISRISAFAAHARGGDIADIGRSLGVTHAIEGSVRCAGGRIRVTAQLVRVCDHCHVWSERYDRDSADAFGIQDEIAEAIAHRLEVTLPGLARPTAAPTASMEAYGRFVEGRHHFFNGTEESLDRARQCFADAIRLDPAFALAHDALSEVYWYMGFYGFVAPKEAFAHGVWDSLRALEIDEQRAESHALLAMLRKELDFDWTEVNREFTRALELDPRSPVVRMRHAISGLLPQGHAAEAAAELEQVVDCDPLNIPVRWFLASMYMFARQSRAMREQVDRMLEIDPRHPLSLMMLGVWQQLEGELGASVISNEKAVELGGRAAWLLGWLGHAYGVAGRTDEARAVLDELQVLSTRQYVSPFAIAMTCLGLGNLDATFLWLDRAIDARDPFVVVLHSYPVLDGIRLDPRYAPLLERMNLSEAAPAAANILRP